MKSSHNNQIKNHVNNKPGTQEKRSRATVKDHKYTRHCTATRKYRDDETKHVEEEGFSQFLAHDMWHRPVHHHAPPFHHRKPSVPERERERERGGW